MWDNIEIGLRAVGRWIISHPRTAAAIAGFVLLAIMWMTNPSLVLNLAVLALGAGLFFQGLLRLFGYGTLWGRKKKD